MGGLSDLGMSHDISEDHADHRLTVSKMSNLEIGKNGYFKQLVYITLAKKGVGIISWLLSTC